VPAAAHGHGAALAPGSRRIAAKSAREEESHNAANADRRTTERKSQALTHGEDFGPRAASAPSTLMGSFVTRLVAQRSN